MEQRELIRRRVVDSREPFDTIVRPLLETGWEKQWLWSGDFLFHTHDYKRVVVTRKALSDLVSSMGDKLSHDLEVILDHADIAILLIEGSWRFVSPYANVITSRGTEHYTYDLIWDYLQSWMDKGFRLQLTTNEGHTVHRLNKLYSMYQRPYSLSAKSRQFTDDRILAFPSGCRGKTGLDCLKQLGNLRAVANASVEQLKAVDNVGDKKAQSIYNHFLKGERK